MLAISGCGGDDEEPSTTPAVTAPTETEPVPVPAETEPEPERDVETQTEAPVAPTEEDQEGGPGDEEPARTLALFTARKGRISPRVVRVPAFISIRVELRSPTGDSYGLRFGRASMQVGGEVNSMALSFDGLRPGEALVGRPTGAGNSVRIEATAEPGP